ncbi:MAG: 4-hydroxyphenylacetate 3-monooxygenase [Acidimicrobiales bacterium]|nr:4-hydroxyphenylacetate 3-monooxygenase [Acidimicrobiales bacterium]MYD82163.1 4-hydroxyphenylacetate 3-monooxygenase [Acidimicrobiales bacterium]MYJ64232.1 4-hydroxyphenylacetate 3-monooxygenase [Acidimicrobiales bacterium]
MKPGAVKDGRAHLAALDTDRAVFLDGELITRVAEHPAFAESCRAIAGLYDFQAANQELMTFDIGDGRRANRAWHMPRSYEDLVAKRVAMTAWAELHAGYMGRSPDHLACAVSGQLMNLDLFEEHNPRCAKAYWDYYQWARANDIFLTYVIINPQGDRSRAWGDQPKQITAHIVDEGPDGPVVRGAKMLGTGSIMAEEVFVANLQPLQAGEEDLAISFALPLDMPGVKIVSRKSFEQHAVSPFDNPLSHRFDENDAIIYFDDVTVPWERVFVYRDTDMCRRQFHETPGHVYQNYQAQVRLVVKLRFLLAVARRLTETIGTLNMVQGKLGELAARVASIEGLLFGMEASGHHVGEHYVPNRHLLYSAQVTTQALYPQLITEIRELAGGGLIMLPSSAADLSSPEVASVLDSTLVSAREGEGAYERMKFLKLAWDAIGSEFASRHTQYEMFYAGAQFVTQGHSFRTYDWDGADRLLDKMLEGNDAEWRGAGQLDAGRDRTGHDTGEADGSGAGEAG